MPGAIETIRRVDLDGKADSLTNPVLGHLDVGVEQLVFARSSGECQRPGGRDRTRCRENGAQHEDLSVRTCGPPDNRGEQQPTEGAPPGKPRQRHLVKPPPTADDAEDSRERDAGQKAEQTEEERKRNVGGTETDDEEEQHARPEPRGRPREAHTDCAANASHPILHCDLTVQLALYDSPL